MKTKFCTLASQACPNRRGQAMVEFALLIPALVLLLVAAMDVARGVYAFAVISNAARVGAHYAALDSKNYAEIEKRTMASIQGLDKTKIFLPLIVSCSQNPDNTYMNGEEHPEQHLCDSWNYITVTVIYTFEPFMLLFTPITMSSQSTMVIE